ncbi:MAG TPA: Ig-like domain-containing protein, partial [Bryobacteraceae bacterium]
MRFSFRKAALAAGIFGFWCSMAYGQSASAVFLPLDSATQGNWVGVYGHDGYIIANDASSLPNYAVVSTAASPYTWSNPSSDVRALLSSPSSGTRIASTFYSDTSFSFDVNLTDGASHQVALYCLDLESTQRTETISILDASSHVALDTRPISSFNSGVYVRWNLTGHVIIQVTHTGNGLSAVVSGLFFAPAVGVGPAPTVSLTSPTAGSTLSGTATLSATASSTPGLASVLFQVDGNNIGTAAAGSGPGFSTTWNTASVANGPHTLTAIATDILGQTTTSAGVSVTTSNVGPPPSGATFVKADTATQGTWKGVYGHDGYIIVNDSNVQPSYATVTPNGAAYTWNASSTDPRALQKGASSTDRIASTYYTTATSGSGSSFSFDVNISDGATHQVALYCLDLDTSARAETISILDATSHAVLSTQAVSNFHNGVYEIWNIASHVTIQVTYTGGQNAVVSGLFLDPVPVTVPAPTVSITGPAGGTSQSGSVTVTATAAATSPATLASVQFQVDGANLGTAQGGSGPYSVSWNTAAGTNGSHTLTAIATDSLGQHTTSAGVTVTVSNAGPPAPTVSITSPTTGATVSAAVTLSATASASSPATLSSVQFQLDGANLGSPVTSGSPYTYQWSPTAASNGTHTLTAIATDSI